MFVLVVGNCQFNFHEGVWWNSGAFGFAEVEEDRGVWALSMSGFWFLLKGASEIFRDNREITAVDNPISSALVSVSFYNFVLWYKTFLHLVVLYFFKILKKYNQVLYLQLTVILFIITIKRQNAGLI